MKVARKVIIINLMESENNYSQFSYFFRDVQTVVFIYLLVLSTYNDDSSLHVILDKNQNCVAE